MKNVNTDCAAVVEVRVKPFKLQQCLCFQSAVDATRRTKWFGERRNCLRDVNFTINCY